MSFEQSALVFGILVPGLVFGVGFLLVAARGGQPGRVAPAALLFAAAFAAGHVGLLGVPPHPGGERALSSSDWTAWFALVGGLLLAFDGFLGRGAPLLRLALVGSLLGLALQATIEYQWEGRQVWTGLAAVGGTAVVLLVAVGDGLRRSTGPSLAIALLVAATCLAVCIALTGSVKIAQTTGLVCSVLGALMIVRWRFPEVPLGFADGTWLVLVLLGLGITAHFYSELLQLDALLLAGALAAPRLADLTPLGGRKKGALRVLLAAVPAAVAVTRCALAFEPDPYGDYEYDYGTSDG